MKLTWLGHACFRLDAAEGSLLFDPYDPAWFPGVTLEKQRVNRVLCSHGHGDHNYVAAAELSGEDRFTVETVATWHDEVQGAKRGGNTVHVVTAEGKRIVHMGDIGHPLSTEQREAIGTPDLLLIPVGGFFTVDAAGAKQICDALGAKHIVPMHYRCGDRGLREIAGVERFTALFDEKEIAYVGSSLEFTELPAQKLLVFSWN